MMNVAGAAALEKSSPRATAVRKTLTLSIYNAQEDCSEEFKAFRADRGNLYIPRDYARKFGFHVDYSTGRSLPQGFMHPVELLPKQVPWVNEVEELFCNGVHDIRAEAHTGAGKTVMALEIARRLNKQTLIVVDQDFLRDQWAERAQEFFGVSPDDIGYIQGKRFDTDKPIVIAMVQSLYRKDLTMPLASKFGTAIFDESHGIGAPVYSKVLSMLPAAHRLAVSATPDRGDQLDKVLEWHLGTVQVVMAVRHQSSVVRVIEHRGCYSWYANSSPKIGRYLQEITEDGERNRLLARAIHELWKKGRTILAVSDRTGQLENLIALCGLLGIPDEEMGLVCGHRTVWKYHKDDAPKRKPKGYVRNTLYTPIRMQLVKKRIPKAALDSAKNTSKIVFATYGMFRKGVDVPRLDTGIDCTPSSKAQQVHGRILRNTIKGKLVPVWVTIREPLSFRAEYQLGRRLVDYQKSNAEVYLWHLDKGLSKQDLQKLKRKVSINHRKLKDAKVLTKRDGNFTIQTSE